MLMRQFVNFWWSYSAALAQRRLQMQLLAGSTDVKAATCIQQAFRRYRSGFLGPIELM